MGLPSVTDINGSNEIIVNGKNVFIVPVKKKMNFAIYAMKN
jgi:hypothetical protein